MYRGFKIVPVAGAKGPFDNGPVKVYGPAGDDKGKFIHKAAAKVWIDALLAAGAAAVRR